MQYSSVGGSSGAAPWDPALYARFAEPRFRPILDLLARVPLARPGFVADLGCGAGQATRVLAAQWPGARVVGVDSSPEMLDEARAGGPGPGPDPGPGAPAFIEADIARWQPAAPPDLIFSNAALHWLPDHEALLPRLVGLLAPGGVLAVQMPRNFAEPSHTTIFETAAEGPWAAALAGRLPDPAPVAPPDAYLRLLRPLCADLEVWETVYWQMLSGPDPVLEWTRATWLRPVLAAVPPAMRADFLKAHAARLAAAYPPEADGRTIFPFRRLFLVARRAG